ncbi:MAG: DUF433 domain-containing protein [Arcicella sp.]|jgi:uncharacterized protein (DUF433 family)|nr:DUF433 domain-containing protein [Arcicella sp.]
MTVSLRELTALVSKLSSTKKAQLLYSISKDLADTFPGIEKTPDVCGGSACIIRTRIPVWTLVSFKKIGISETMLLSSYPALRKQDLNNAWAYYKANKHEIDNDISQNNE